MANDVLFSEWLNEQMRRERLTQAELAKAAGLRPSTINKMLNSKTKQPRPDSCEAIAKALGISGDTVLRAAKISKTKPEFQELDDLKLVVGQLSSQERQKILAIAKVLLDFEKKNNART